MSAAGSGLLALVLLYWLPGAGLVELLWPELRRDPRHDRLSRVAISVSLSLAVAPVLTLWCWTFGVRAGPWLAWMPGLLGLGVVAWAAHRRRSQPSPHARHGAGLGWVDGVVALILVLTAASRWLAVRPLVLPAWGDSVQHSFITQLLLDHRGLFQSWAPYAPMESLTYHFGFHAMAASWSWITGASAPDSVLVVGQLTGVAAVLALYPLALQLTDGRRAAGAGALLVAGLLSPMPAFYASWGRYTQLAGQVLLPVLVCLLDVTWLDRKRSSRGVLVLVGLLLAGLFLTHYRVALLAATAAVVWPIAAAWRWRGARSEWTGRASAFAVVALLSVLAVAPWLVVLGDGLLIPVHQMLAAIDPAVFSLQDPLRAWASIPARVPWILAAGLVAALVAGALVRERAVGLVLGWSALALVATNPFVVGLPGTGFVTSFALAIAAYIPAALLVGWAIGRSVPWLETRSGGRAAIAGAFIVAALVGFNERRVPVARDFRLATAADLRAFAWIREHVDPAAHFQVNTGLAYGGKTAVGTDGGWWLPLLAARSSTLPPLTYTVEHMPGKTRYAVWSYPTWLRRNRLIPRFVHDVLCVQGVTHIYLGAKRGSVGAGGEPLMREEQLAADPAMTLLHRDGRAQVWRFDRTDCRDP